MYALLLMWHKQAQENHSAYTRSILWIFDLFSLCFGLNILDLINARRKQLHTETNTHT